MLPADTSKPPPEPGKEWPVQKTTTRIWPPARKVVRNLMDAEPGGHRRFCEPESRLPRDVEELQKFSLPYGLRKLRVCFPDGKARSRSVPGGESDQCVSRGGQVKSLADDISALERLFGQLSVCFQDHRDGIFQIHACLFKSFPLCVCARQFFDKRDVTFRDLHVYSRQAHLGHILQSYQDACNRHRPGRDSITPADLEPFLCSRSPSKDSVDFGG